MIEIQIVSQRTSGQNLALRNAVTSQNCCHYFKILYHCKTLKLQQQQTAAELTKTSFEIELAKIVFF